MFSDPKLEARVIDRAREILRRHPGIYCSCVAPESGHSPDCSYVRVEEDAWCEAHDQIIDELDTEEAEGND